MLRRVVLSFAIASLACGEPSSPRPATATAADKRALYADPMLVPTREGERIRAEIALAGEIEQALRVFPELQGVRVHVESATAPMRVAVFGAAPTELVAQLRTRIDEVARAVAGDDIVGVTTIAALDPEPPAPEPRLHLVLALALLGLGASMGIAADRFARRRRRN
jgi:hypothetical protein